jgi:hypothetical protein
LQLKQFFPIASHFEKQNILKVGNNKNAKA